MNSLQTTSGEWMTLSLAEAIARVPQWASAKDLKTAPLSGGITNQNFRVDVNGESFVLRICGNATDLVGINREAEYIANGAAGKLGIAPKVFCRIQPENYLVTRFIHGRPVPPAEMGKPENIRRVTESLKQFHALPLALPTTFLPFRRVEYLTTVARDHGAIFPRNFDWLVERMREVEAAFRRDPFVPRPCHDDLLNANFLVEDSSLGNDGRILIIDWEFAGMGDITFDLANFASHHRFNDDQSRWLLECYFGEITPRRFARLQLMRSVSEIHEAMMGMAQAGLSKLDFDFHEYADLWFGRATEAIHDPRWGDCLKEIAHV
jgi:thiamine kinase-like enzyme